MLFIGAGIQGFEEGPRDSLSWVFGTVHYANGARCYGCCQIVIETTHHEKRAVPRASNSLLVKIAQGDDRIDAISQDFSLTGAKLSLPRKLDPNQIVELKMYLPHEDLRVYESQEPITLMAEVTWQEVQDGRNRCMAGVQFKDVKESDRLKIVECFEFFNMSPEF